MTTLVRTSRTRDLCAIRCHQCPAGFEWTRKKARQHAAQTGHMVEVLVEEITTYTAEATP